MFYFVIFDLITLFGLLFFGLNLVYVLVIYLWPLKRQQYLIRKTPLFFNIMWLLSELIFCVLAYLVNYQFESIFNKQYSLESSIILIAALSGIFFFLSLFFTIYLLIFNSVFVIYSPKGLTNMEAFKTNRYLVENETITNLKTQQLVPNKKWIKLK